MLKIFISYRRKDTMATAGRLFDRLEKRYGAESIFLDVDTIPFGVDFRAYLAEQVAQSNIFLVMIGNNWFGMNPNGDRRIDDNGDFLRIEIESALNRGIAIIPILVDGASMPSTKELPTSISELAFQNGLVVDNGRDFNTHIERLCRGIDYLIEKGIETKTDSTESGDSDDQKLSTMCDKCGKASRIHVYDIAHRKNVNLTHLCESCSAIFPLKFSYK